MLMVQSSLRDVYKRQPYDRDYRSLYDFPKINDNSKEKKHIKLVENPFTIVGYTLLGSLGCDGIKYYWKKDDKYVESIAFNRRLRNLKIKEDADISAYTISTSFGCVLSATCLLYTSRCV